jgi:superfamily II DNA or RNA helicase
MEMIALLIFDECHHAQAKSSHPYAEIMKVCCTFGSMAQPFKTENATHFYEFSLSILIVYNFMIKMF